MSADSWAVCPRCGDDEYRPHFREDYEIYGAETGVVTVSYSGHCRDCGLSLAFEKHEPIPGVNQ